VIAEERDLRRLAGWALAAGLCVAAAVAVYALLTGSFGDTHWRVVGTSVGFGVLTSTAAAGAGLRARADRRLRVLGAATAALSALAFAALVIALWRDGDDAWRAFGVAGLGALWTSHASLMYAARRPRDSAAVRALTLVAVLALGVDTVAGVLALLDAVEPEDAGARALAAVLVVALLASALAPLLRRLARRQAATAAVPAGLAAEVADVADRLAAMDLPPAARAEVARSQRLAR